MFEPLPFVVEAPGDEAATTAAANAAAASWGLGLPSLVRLGINGVFVVGDTVLRVSRTTAPPTLALDLALALRSEGLRVAEPLFADVFDAGSGITVSAWKRIDGGPPTTADWP
jgi:hypothetical protein